MPIDNPIEITSPTTTTPTPLLSSSSKNSTSNLLINNLTTSFIKLNVNELNLKLYNEIIVSWNIINDETTSNDWIGIYKFDGNLINYYHLYSIFISFFSIYNYRS